MPLSQYLKNEILKASPLLTKQPETQDFVFAFLEEKFDPQQPNSINEKVKESLREELTPFSEFMGQVDLGKFCGTIFNVLEKNLPKPQQQIQSSSSKEYDQNYSHKRRRSLSPSENYQQQQSSEQSAYKKRRNNDYDPYSQSQQNPDYHNKSRPNFGQQQQPYNSEQSNYPYQKRTPNFGPGYQKNSNPAGGDSQGRRFGGSSHHYQQQPVEQQASASGNQIQTVTSSDQSIPPHQSRYNKYEPRTYQQQQPHYNKYAQHEQDANFQKNDGVDMGISSNQAPYSKPYQYQNKPYQKPSFRSIRVSEIPEENNDIGQLNDHFKQFGTINDVKCQKNAQTAYIEFETAEGAKAAVDSAVPIFGNRFITVSWAKIQPQDNKNASVPPEGGLQPQYKKTGPYNKMNRNYQSQQPYDPNFKKNRPFGSKFGGPTDPASSTTGSVDSEASTVKIDVPDKAEVGASIPEKPKPAQHTVLKNEVVENSRKLIDQMIESYLALYKGLLGEMEVLEKEEKNLDVKKGEGMEAEMYESQKKKISENKQEITKKLGECDSALTGLYEKIAALDKAALKMKKTSSTADVKTTENVAKDEPAQPKTDPPTSVAETAKPSVEATDVAQPTKDAAKIEQAIQMIEMDQLRSASSNDDDFTFDDDDEMSDDIRRR